jgi:hypothetical protein
VPRRTKASKTFHIRQILSIQALGKFYPNLNDVCFSRSIPSGVSDRRLFYPSRAFSRMLPTCAGKWSRNPAYCSLMLTFRPFPAKWQGESAYLFLIIFGNYGRRITFSSDSFIFLKKLHRYRPPDYRCYDRHRRPQRIVP